MTTLVPSPSGPRRFPLLPQLHALVAQTPSTTAATSIEPSSAAPGPQGLASATDLPPGLQAPQPERATSFHILSFEGPDPYARAGGISSRICGLAETLAASGFETHLWFIGDPGAPCSERRGHLHLHRWGQWISRHHPLGVYDGEDGKADDYARSLPPHLLEQWLRPHLDAGGDAVVMAEEWHTAYAVQHLDWLLRQAQLRGRVQLLWNANNVFGFDRIDWPALRDAATITTVSRYMKHRMAPLGVDPVVVPNGVADDAFLPVDPRHLAEVRRRTRGRLLLAKVARWDPDKRWLGTMDVTAELRRRNLRPLLVARGGIEAHGHEVLAHARALGLRVVERASERTGVPALLDELADTADADVVLLRRHLDPDGRRLLFRAAAAVLANSGHEPFGLVGLEAMAAGGLACTGCSGEEYAIPGRNAIVLHTGDPNELVGTMLRLAADPMAERAMRRAGRLTARQFAWSEVLDRHLLPRLELLSLAAT